MFIDKVEIVIKAGNGGNGHVSFFRDKLNMRGGPDGGDGGKGGDIIFIGTTNVDNLVSFRFSKKFYAPDGENGGKRHKTGKNGEDIKIFLPVGTKIFNHEKQLVADITEQNEEYKALRGGVGGRGNARFATSKKQTPNFSQSGVKTTEYRVTLELNSIADIGLVGFPNVGKSTLLSIISRANPKIANYHFTTLHPNIAVTTINNQNIIVADIPGLIEGASQGAGLGISFLKHISRTRLLIHVIDIAECDGRKALEDFYTINKELANFSEELAKKPQIIALNKTDISTDRVEAFKREINKGKRKFQIYQISAATREGVDALMKTAAELLSQLPKCEKSEPKTQLEKMIDKNKFTIESIDGEYIVTGPMIDNLIRGVVLSDTESNHYFQRRLVESGIIAELKKQGIQNGDTVHIAEIEFEYID